MDYGADEVDRGSSGHDRCGYMLRMGDSEIVVRCLYIVYLCNLRMDSDFEVGISPHLAAPSIICLEHYA